jgi:hypothetical protein
MNSDWDVTIKSRGKAARGVRLIENARGTPSPTVLPDPRDGAEEPGSVRGANPSP